MVGYIIRRLLYMIPILLGVALLVFTLFTTVGEDPVRIALGNHASPEAIAELLAAEQKKRPELTLVIFAPLNLLPGQSVPTKSRRAGSSLGRYRSMANDLFKS